MIHFGTGGWRAIIADEFTRANIQLLAQALSEKMLSEDAHEIVIGFDRRFLSDVGAQWACEVFAANGITPYYIPKNAPTPLIMFAVNTAWQLPPAITPRFIMASRCSPPEAETRTKQ